MIVLRDRVFVSYSHTDNNFLKRLEVHLKPYELESKLEVWSDNRIKPGQIWYQEIEASLERTAVAVLLVSADYLASEFIQNKELPILLEASEQIGIRIIPVILRHCAFEEANLSKFHAINDPSKPLESMKRPQREKTWVHLAKSIQEAMVDFKAQAEAKEKALDQQPGTNIAVQWSKAATLFWLGNDLMWIQDMLYRMASPKRVLQGIYHAIKYSEELGFPQTPPLLRELYIAQITLESLGDYYPSTDENKDDLESHYRNVIHYIQITKWVVSGLAETVQPDFKKLRAL